MTAASSGQLSAGQAEGCPLLVTWWAMCSETTAFAGPGSDGLAAARGWWWAQERVSFHSPLHDSGAGICPHRLVGVALCWDPTIDQGWIQVLLLLCLETGLETDLPSPTLLQVYTRCPQPVPSSSGLSPHL